MNAALRAMDRAKGDQVKADILQDKSWFEVMYDQVVYNEWVKRENKKIKDEINSVKNKR